MKAWLWRNALTRTLLTQASFLKKSFKQQREHLYCSDLKLAYIRIPKAASTSASMMMLRHIHKTLQVDQLSSTEINFLTDISLHSIISEDERTGRFFTIVRNPFARIVSVYKDFFESGSGDFIYQDYLFGVFSRNISFKEFVHRLDAIPDALKDQHIKPQCLFLKYYERKRVDLEIFKLEKPGEAEFFLSRYNVKLPFINKSAGSYDYRSYYDIESFIKVSAIYKRDIKIFYYEKEAALLKDFLLNKK